MTIGIAPGRVAISSGKAFAGNSITRMLRWFSEAGFEMTEPQFRRALYFTSLIKCGAVPDTRNNRTALWGRCSSFLWRQIHLVRPELILLLGQEPLAMILSSRRVLAKDTVGTCWTTEELFVSELFPPIEWTTNWLSMPHPSGLSRTMNDSHTHRRVIEALRLNLLKIGFHS